MTKSRKKRTLTQRELRALQATPGLLTTRYDAAGERAIVQQLSPESDARRKDFAHRLTSPDDDISTSEEGR